MVHVKIQTREVVQEDLPQTTLDVLAKDMSRIYLDNSVLSRDYGAPMQSYLDYLRHGMEQKSPDDFGTSNRWGSSNGWGFPDGSRLQQQHDHTKSFLETIEVYENIVTSPKIISEYDQYIYLLQDATHNPKSHPHSSYDEFVLLEEIIEFHQSIYQLLRQRLTPYTPLEKIDFPKFLRESTLHRPYEGKFQKRMTAVTARPSFADAELVGRAIDFSYQSALKKQPSKVAIIAADLDIVNLVRNFGTTMEGAACRGLGASVVVYFPSNDWQNNMGVNFQSDSTGFNKYETEKTEIIVKP